MLDCIACWIALLVVKYCILGSIASWTFILASAVLHVGEYCMLDSIAG